MRAREFIAEQFAKPSKRIQNPTRGLNLFTDSNYDRIYMLNRVMMGAASTDGTYEPEFEDESYVAKHNTAHPYTKAEQNKLIMAYKAAGVKYKDLNNGDLESRELDSTYTVSPIKPFKGYEK